METGRECYNGFAFSRIGAGAMPFFGERNQGRAFQACCRLPRRTPFVQFSDKISFSTARAGAYRRRAKCRRSLSQAGCFSGIICRTFGEKLDVSFNDVVILGALTAFTLALNLPFGLMRSKAERYSLRWFLCIHLPIPFIYLLRKYFMFSAPAIPLLFAAAVLGQIGGGKIKEQKRD
jgi:hypothetical protein